MTTELEKALASEDPPIRLIAGSCPGAVTDEDGWAHYPWTCVITHRGQSMTVDYRAGLAHVRPRYRWEPRGPVDPIPPTLADVLYSLLSDADAGSRTFGEFCDEFGYDTDSRRALDTYLACQQAHADLVRVLGRALMIRLAGLEH